MKKICIVTGTRAEWGLLSSLAKLLRDDPGIELQIVVTNMHLEERYGMTCHEIEEQGFTIDYRVPMHAESDDRRAIVQSIGRAMSGFADAYEALSPDLLVVLGDRYELIAAVSAALLFKIPVAHLHGGEITEGAYDDAIRHAITKMSHLHFTSTEVYRQRVIQMGEHPDTVFNVGAIGVDNMKTLPLWSREETERSLGGFTLDRDTALVTYHPVTLSDESAAVQIETLLEALDAVTKLRVIFTMPNSDTDNWAIAEAIGRWCERNADRAVCFTSLGQMRYLSVLQYIGMVVGNSSSGVIEVPSFNIPTLDIGDRQKGRIAAESVHHCSLNKNEIEANILLLLKRGSGMQVSNPYDKPGTARAIFEIIKQSKFLLQKHFYDKP